MATEELPDPHGRNEVWDAIRGLVEGGTTVLLTTQYLDEADQLADRIAVIDTGRVIAEGTPNELKSRIGGDRLDAVVHDASELPAAAAILARVAGQSAETDAENRRASVAVSDRVRTLTDALRALDEAGIEAEDIALRRPTLDEVFLQLTGRRADTTSDDEGQQEAAA